MRKNFSGEARFGYQESPSCKYLYIYLPADSREQPFDIAGSRDGRKEKFPVRETGAILRCWSGLNPPLSAKFPDLQGVRKQVRNFFRV